MRPAQTPVHLEPYTNQLRTVVLNGSPTRAGNDLHRVPGGHVVLGGIAWDVGNRIIHLRGKNATTWPWRVAGIVVEKPVSALHFLHAVGFGTGHGAGLITQGEGIPVARYSVHYQSGNAEDIPIRYGREVRDWWAFTDRPQTTDKNTVVAWQKDNLYLEQCHADGQWHKVQGIRLFRTTWINPHPAFVVQTLDLESLDGECDPFVLAISLTLRSHRESRTRHG